MGAEKEYLSEYNRIYKENDELYKTAAKTMGLSDCAFWILYFLRECNAELTQSEICSAIYAPKQTVNSSLKKLEEEGYLCLAEGNDRRSKLVGLTQKGQEFAAITVDRVLEAELRAFGELTPGEQSLFLGLFRKYTELLKKEIRTVKQTKKFGEGEQK